MKLSTRYGLLGLGALALLSTGHWLRELSGDWVPALRYLLGVLPNFAAAIAIPFVFMGIVADQKKHAPLSTIRNWFFVSVIVSCVGLICWELFQRTTKQLTFDVNDIMATIVGSLISVGLFAAVTKRSRNPA